jgi:hypothetical protein
MAVIPNTLELAQLWVSPTLLQEAQRLPHLEVCGAPQPVPFGARGDLEQERLFPQCLRARRRTRNG